MCCTKISIIGAGLSSVLTALALSRENQHLEIEIYEKEKALLLKGLAYSSSLPYQPLNVIASKMSILPDIDTHFVDWLYDYYEHTQTKEALSQTFQPRNIFAIYLEQTFKELLPNIKIVEDEVIDIEVVGEHKILKLKSGTQVQTDFIVLATGNADSLPLKNVANYQGLVINRLADVNIQSMKDTKHLLIVGSGLSAIDIIGSLYTLNYQGKIDLISRRGLLPAAHKPTHKQAHHLDIDISDLILNARPSIYDYFRFFRAKIKEHRNFPWQDIIDAVREYTPQLWDNLPETDKIIFLRRLKPFWEIHRHRMPIASFDIIQKMKNDGRLNVFKSEITASENQRITLSNHTVIEPDAIINCTGQNTDIDSQSILLANLHQKGIFIADNLKLGILTTPEGEVVSRQNAATNIFTIGALRKAKEYECIAARELKIQATALAKSIQKRILLNDLEGILNFDDFTKKAFTYDLNVYKHFLPPAAFVPDTYTRTLVYQKKYTIFLLVWGGKAVTDIHDHAASTAKIKVLQGKIKEQKYSVGNGFNIDCEMIYGAGDTFGESPNDIHRVTNSSNDFSISLHIYNTDSPTLDGVRIFDSENRKVGYLNSSAKSSTWNQPPSAFDKVISF